MNLPRTDGRTCTLVGTDIDVRVLSSIITVGKPSRYQSWLLVAYPPTDADNEVATKPGPIDAETTHHTALSHAPCSTIKIDLNHPALHAPTLSTGGRTARGRLEMEADARYGCNGQE